MMSRDERKTRGIDRFINSFKYSFRGLRYAYKNEQTVFVDVLMAVTVFLLGYMLEISYFEWMVIVLLVGLVITSELINTALEATVDLVTQDYHPLAKVAKDTASAAVLVLSLTSAIVGIIIFLPKIIELF